MTDTTILRCNSQEAMLEGAVKMQKACAKVFLDIGAAHYSEEDILALDPQEVIK